MKHRISDVLIGVTVGVLITFAFTVKAERVTYIAPEEAITEPEEVLIEVETEEQKIERLIREEFVDAPIMVEVARCESTFRNVCSTTGDCGPLQINQVHLKTLEMLGLDRTKIEDNIEFGRILYNEQGLKPWYNSKHCWNK